MYINLSKKKLHDVIFHIHHDNDFIFVSTVVYSINDAMFIKFNKV